jgi:Carboxypeptidase regulatory-like domain
MTPNRSAMKAAALGAVVIFLICAGSGALADKKEKSVGRLLYGKVLDGQDNPLPDAVVYVTNSRTRAVKTYIVGADGSYRFPALSTAVDYEVYAQYNGHKSDSKAVSQFDDRAEVYLDLKIDTH